LYSRAFVFDTSPHPTGPSAPSYAKIAATPAPARAVDILRERILTPRAAIGAIGPGDVGLAEAVELATVVFPVVRFDVDTSVDGERIVDHAPVVVDSRDATANVIAGRSRVVRP
jgi:hypothetical protein